MYGFYRLAAAIPQLSLGNVPENTKAIVDQVRSAASEGANLIAFPELSLSGYSCGDLFYQEHLLAHVLEGLFEIAQKTRDSEIVVVVGAPLFVRSRLYNCAIVIQNGQLLGAVPKSYLPNYCEFYEKRWFVSGKGTHTNEIQLGAVHIPFGTDLIFESGLFSFGIEICEDLWHIIPPSSYHASAGALITVNLSASNELVGKAHYRQRLVENQSARCVSAYLYTSSGSNESSTDAIFGGDAMIVENGTLLCQSQRLQDQAAIFYADVDCHRLAITRNRETSFSDAQEQSFRHIQLRTPKSIRTLTRAIDPHPFIPSNEAKRQSVCDEITALQAVALARRLRHTRCKTAVIGISGGLDSTLALLVAHKAACKLGWSPKQIIAVSMPGFASSDTTQNNAKNLCHALDVEFRLIPIIESCRLHFKQINHDASIHDTTFENIQARERTKILMNLANQQSGIVVGTGDLSEIALGWSTYNGDHMSMYNVNCGVPKTLVQYIIQTFSRDPALQPILEAIINTPISPELVPGDNPLSQKTEEIIGPYELHDFFLYHFVKYGAKPEKIQFLAENAFHENYPEDVIAKWLQLFIKRFITQQFKRSCMPDGPKIGTIGLSPRSDWRMPSDISPAMWIK